MEIKITAKAIKDGCIVGSKVSDKFERLEATYIVLALEDIRDNLRMCLREQRNDCKKVKMK